MIYEAYEGVGRSRARALRRRLTELNLPYTEKKRLLTSSFTVVAYHSWQRPSLFLLSSETKRWKDR